MQVGHTMAQLPHCAQLSTFHSGTFTAMPRFSNLAVPVGTEPSTVNAETGSLSPSWDRMGRITISKYSSASTYTGRAPLVASAHSAGTGISRIPLTAMSMAAQFLLTISSPLLP